MEVFIMITITIKGKQYYCLEHMKEIKDLVENDELFARFYNKKQMFKFLENNMPVGHIGLLGIPTYGSWEHSVEAMMIEAYKVDDSTINVITNDYDLWESEVDRVDKRIESNRKYKEDPVLKDIKWTVFGSSFFVKDDNGDIFFIITDVD